MINLGKQVHALRVEAIASPQGTKIGEIPKKAFIYDVLFHNPHDWPDAYYGESTISVGVPGNKDWIAKKTSIKGGGCFRAQLGRGAGLQGLDDIKPIAFWHYSGEGNPSSGLITILVLYDLS